MPERRPWSLLRAAIRDFGADNAMSMAAAVAFYTALSFAPLVLLLVAIGGLLGESAQTDVLRFFQEQVGPQAAEVTGEIIETADRAERRAGPWRWIFSTGMLLFTASGVFGELQASLNRVWDVKAKPGQGLWGWVRKRLLSMGMVFAILFILLVALVLSALIERILPRAEGLAARAGLFAASFVVSTLLFAAIYKVLPDVKMAWRAVWTGALLTAVLFSLGKLGLGLYLEHGSVGRSYGASGALIALLVWVYYSCVILFIGAEVTQQYARQRGLPIEPDQHAVFESDAAEAGKQEAKGA